MGILASRLAGLVRQWLIARYLGSGPQAAAYAAALRIPNALQNLLGEGALSASFIPAYAGLQGAGREQDARRLGWVIARLLALVGGGLATAGVLFAPALVRVLAPGFDGELRELTVLLVRLMFPGTFLLVGSAFCLGVLNSHGRFALPYLAPLAWNAALIAALIIFRGNPDERLVQYLGVAYFVGCALQFLVQLPTVLKLLSPVEGRMGIRSPEVRAVLVGFVPALLTRGVIQVSASVDLAYASLTTAAAVATLSYAQTIAILPVSVFGLATAAAELPALSRAAATNVERAPIIARLKAARERLAFFIAPSTLAFLAIGDAVAGLLLQSNRFTPLDTRFAWYLLIGFALALPAQTTGRLYSSAFYALKDTRLPLRAASLRVLLVIVVGYVAVRIVPEYFGLPPELGAVLLVLTSGLSAWVELAVLRYALKRTYDLTVEVSTLRPYVAAVVAALAALALKAGAVWSFGAEPLAIFGGELLPTPATHQRLVAAAVVLTFCLVYGLCAVLLRIPEAERLLRRKRVTSAFPRS